MRRTFRQTERRSRFASIGTTGGRAIGLPGSGSAIPGPVDYRQAPAPGSYKNAALGVPVHTHEHDALLGLNDDDHSNVAYLRAPRAKLRIVAPAGAPYSDPKTAIEACALGDCVLILAGTYDIATTITIPANAIAILGASRDGVVLNFTAADANHCISGTVDGTTIRHLTVRAVAGKTGDGIRLVQTPTAAYSVIEDVAITGDDLTSGIQVSSARRVYIGHCAITGGMQNGILVVNADAASLIQNLIETDYVGAIGIYLNQGDETLIEGNTIYLQGSAGGKGIYAIVDLNHVRISSNYVECASPGAGTHGIHGFVSIAGAHIANSIYDNTVISDSQTGDGVLISAAVGSTFDDTRISDNICYDWNRGVRVNNIRCTNTLVHGNHTRTCAVNISDAGAATSNWDNT